MPRLLSRAFVLAVAANLTFFLGVTVFFSLPVRLGELGANEAEIGRIMSTFGAASLVAIPVTGQLADRFGRKPFVALGAVLWSLASLAFAGVDHLGAWPYALRLLQGVAFPLAFVSLNVIVADVAPPAALGRAIALLGTATLTAHAIGPSVGEQFAARWGFPALFVCAALFPLLALVPLSYLPEPGPVRGSVGAPGWWRLASRPGAWGSLAGALASAVGFGSAIAFMPVFVRARGIGVHAPFFVGYVVAAIAVRLVGGGLGDRIGHRRVAIAGSLGLGVAVACLALVHSAQSLALVGLFFGSVHGFAYPALNATFLDGVGPDARGRAMALFNLAFNLGSSAAGLATGEIAHRLGYGVAWCVAGAVALTAPLLVALDRTAPRRSLAALPADVTPEPPLGT